MQETQDEGIGKDHIYTNANLGSLFLFFLVFVGREDWSILFFRLVNKNGRNGKIHTKLLKVCVVWQRLVSIHLLDWGPGPETDSACCFDFVLIVGNNYNIGFSFLELFLTLAHRVKVARFSLPPLTTAYLPPQKYSKPNPSIYRADVSNIFNNNNEWRPQSIIWIK